MYTPPELLTWINGVPEPSESQTDAVLADPNTGRDVQPLRASSSGQLDRAIAVAEKVHRDGGWRTGGVAARAAALNRFADALADRCEDIAVLDAVNTGVPVSVTRMFSASLAGTVRQAAVLAVELGDEVTLPAEQGPVRLRRVPWGPTALVIPWNAPSAIMVKKAAFALAAGAPVIVKPSPFAPWSAQLIAEAAATTLPPGVVGVVLGDGAIGAALCADTRVAAISMTGATSTGKSIARAAADNLTRLRLELGSTNPAVVCADADVAATAQSLCDGMVKLNGQWCEAPRSVFVDRSVHGELISALSALVSQMSVGPSLDATTQIGPMAFSTRRYQLEDQRARLVSSGRRVVAGVDVPKYGAFFGPTVVDGSGTDLGEEVFGPMLVVESCASEHAAVLRANQVAGGLAAYVFTGDIPRGLALTGQLVGGEVKLNGTSVLDMSPESAQSFFGRSGIGGHGDRDVLQFYSGKQVAGVDLVDARL
jgi:phenylacetaldehyde dehydrogenase